MAALCTSIMDVAEKNLDAASTSPKEKSVLKRTLAQVHAASSPAMKKVIAERFPSAKRWSPNKRAAVTRKPHVSDSDLVNAIDEFAAPCSRYSRRHKTGFKNLQCSKSVLQFKLKKKGIKIGKRWLSKRLQNGKLGFCTGFRRSDDCSSCRTWRVQILPKLKKLYDVAEISDLCPSMWDGFDWAKRDEEKAVFLRSLIDHTISHTTVCENCPAAMYLYDLKKDLEENELHVDRFQWYWWHKDQLQSEIGEMGERLARRTLYMKIDYQEAWPAWDPPQ